MRCSRVRAARGWILGAGLLMSAALVFTVSLVLPVSAQTKKPTAKAGNTKPEKLAPNAKPAASAKNSTTTKSTDAAPTIPGFPPNMPAAAREAIAQQLQQQLDERTSRRKQAVKEAETWLRRAESEQDAESQAGALVMAGAKQVDALKLSEAVQTFRRVTTEHPVSLWSHEARLFLCDLALERQLDPQRATDHLQPALEWLKTVNAPASAPAPLVSTLAMNEFSASGTLPVQSIGPSLVSITKAEDGNAASPGDSAASDSATGSPINSFTPREAHQIAADVRLRSGLLAWLRDDASAAKAEFQHALVLHEGEATPLTVLAHKLRLNQRIATVPDPVKNGNADCAQLIRLALVLTEAPQTYRAHRLWNAIAKRPAEQQTLPQKSFVLFHRAQTRFRFQNPLERDAAAILADYEASVKAYPLADWADDALFLAGNVEFNLNRNTDKAVEHWRQVLNRQPASEHQQRAAYYIGVALETARKWDEAKLAYDDAKSRFPESQFNPLIDKHLKKVASELSRLKPKPSG